MPMMQILKIAAENSKKFSKPSTKNPIIKNKKLIIIIGFLLMLRAN